MPLIRSYGYCLHVYGIAPNVQLAVRRRLRQQLAYSPGAFHAAGVSGILHTIV